MDIELLKLIVPLTGAAGAAAWAGVKVALNGTRKAIADARTEAKDDHIAMSAEVRILRNHTEANTIGLARIEGRLGITHE